MTGRAIPGEVLEGPEWSAENRVRISVPKAAAWSLVATPGHLEQCHPFCRRNPVRRWPGTGAMDEIEYWSGLHLVREVFEWREGEGFRLWIGPPDSISSRVTWRFEEVGEGASEIAIRIDPVPPASVSRKAFERLYRRRTKPSLEDYLRAVGEGLRYRLETGERVARNQFGAHPVFSPEAADADQGR